MRLSRSSTASTRRNRSCYGGYLRVSSGEDGRPPGTTPENYQFRALTFALLPRGKLIHPPSWNRNSANFAFIEFCELRLLGILGSRTSALRSSRKFDCRGMPCHLRAAS